MMILQCYIYEPFNASSTFKRSFHLFEPLVISDIMRQMTFENPDIESQGSEI